MNEPINIWMNDHLAISMNGHKKTGVSGLRETEQAAYTAACFCFGIELGHLTMAVSIDAAEQGAMVGFEVMTSAMKANKP